MNVEIGAAANPPGFDEQLLGLEVGATKTFTIHYPSDYAIAELAGTDVEYTVAVKALKRRKLPELDDEFAKDLGAFETLDALRARVREDLEHEARHAADREVRAQLMKQLAARVPFDVPASLARAGAGSSNRRVRAPARSIRRSIPTRRVSTGARSGTASAIRRARQWRRRWSRGGRAARAARRDRRGGRSRSGALRRADWAAPRRPCVRELEKEARSVTRAARACAGRRQLTS